ncbi:MAG: hypothetical protein QW764_04685 [Desulfurococcaceae archaeon]
MSQVIEFDGLVKETVSSVEKVVSELESLRKILDEATRYDKEVSIKLENLVRGWYCIWDITLNYGRNECRFNIFPKSDNVTVIVDVPDYIRVDAPNNTPLDEIKKAVREELVKNFHLQLRATSRKIIEIMEIAKEIMKKDVSQNLMELCKKIGEIDAKVYQIQKKIEELRERREELLREIEELEERKEELLQEIEELEERKEMEKEEEEEEDEGILRKMINTIFGKGGEKDGA